MAVTEDQIHTACERLDAAGEKLTAEKIREALGGTGSFSTIQRYLRTYTGTSEPPAPDMPMEVARDVQAGAQVLWRGAVRAAREEFRAEREKLLTSITDLTSAVRYTEADVAAREGERDVLQAANDKLRTRCNGLEGKLKQQEARVHTLIGRLEAYESVRAANTTGNPRAAIRGGQATAPIAPRPRGRAGRLAQGYEAAVRTGEPAVGSEPDEV